MRRLSLVIVAVLVAPSVACSNKLSGSVEVNGETLKIESCRNGAVHGYRGVELTASNGTRLRVGALPTGAAGVIVMPPGATVGTELGVGCGSLTISDQNSTVNNVKNVEGKAVLDCEAAGFKVKGQVTFANCH